MGLKLKSALVVILVGLPGCIGKMGVTPADQGVINQTWYFDCCAKDIIKGTQEMCELAKNTSDKILIDQDGNKYVFFWGKEGENACK